MSHASGNWHWSAEHQTHYRHEYRDGQWVIIWPGGALSRYGSAQVHERSDSAQGSYSDASYRQNQDPYPYYRYPPHLPTQDTTPNSSPSAINYPSKNSTQVTSLLQPPTPSSPSKAYVPTSASAYHTSSSQTLSATPNPRSSSQLRPSPGQIGAQGHHMLNTYGQTSESLGPTFYVRSKQFFDVGRVFAILFTEPAGSTLTQYNTSLSMVKFGQYVHSQVRRFVVVVSKQEFCYACPIFTYGWKGTLKPGVRPAEHAIIFTQGQSPELLPGEGQLGKLPIMVGQNFDANVMHRASRLNFGIHHPIQYNVKVKDLGMVVNADIPRLCGYWKEEMLSLSNLASAKQLSIQNGEEGENENVGYEEEDEDEDEDDEEEPQDIVRHMASSSLEPACIPTQSTAPPVLLQPKSEKSQVPLDSSFEVISNPKAFFKKGRVFLTHWDEPRSHNQAEKLDETCKQPARFAVVRARTTHSLCLRISTYAGQATSKPGIVAQDHAAVVPVGGEVQSHPREEILTKSPIYVKLEAEGFTLDPMSRMDFGKVYTVEHDIAVRKVGRVFGDSIGVMDEYFAASLGLAKR